MTTITARTKDAMGGALMIALGVFAVVQGWSYRIGTVSQMGPGFFPTAIGCVLILSGLGIVLGPLLAQASQARQAIAAEWRGQLCIVLSIVAFVVLGRFTGLLPATFAIVFIAALGDRQNTLRSTLALAVVMMLVAVVVFWWALKIQLPLLAWGGS